MSGLSRRLIRGAGLMLVAQIAGVAFQFGYAAFVSRWLSASDFGKYGITLSLISLTQLVLTSGIGQAAARTSAEATDQKRAIVGRSIFSGIGTAIILFAVAPLWSSIWGIDSTTDTRVACLSTLLAPYIAVQSGFLRRRGCYGRVALAQFCAAFAGVCAGIIFTYFIRESWTLVTTFVVSNIINSIALSIVRSHRVRPTFRLEAIAATKSFVRRVTLVNILTYIGSNIGKFGLGNAAGAAALGAWNRADTLTLVPLQMVQVATTQTAYSHLDTSEDPSNRRVGAMSEMVILSAWASAIAGTLLATGAPVLALLLLGPQWASLGDLITKLAIVYALGVTPTLIHIVHEASAIFRPLWVSEILAMVVQATACVFVFMHGSIDAALVGMAAAALLRAGVLVTSASRAGLVDGKSVGAAYVAAWATSLMCVAAYECLLRSSTEGSAPSYTELLLPLAVTWLMVVLLVSATARMKTGPLLLARRFTARDDGGLTTVNRMS